MRKQLYLDIKNRIKTITDTEDVSVFKHFDIWNRQVEFMQQEKPFLFPAVFIEFLPMRWQSTGQGKQQAELTVKLHIVSKWKASTSDNSAYEDQALAYLDLPNYVNKCLAGFAATNTNGFLRTGSSINHNHEDVIDSTEEFITNVWDDTAMEDLQPIENAGFTLNDRNGNPLSIEPPPEAT